MTEFQHIDWCSSTGEYGAPDCGCPGADEVRASRVVTPDAVKALLMDHRPAICERMHFVCSGCNWHESFKGTPQEATEESNQRWWAEFIDHLTAPTENKEALN